MDIVKRPHDTCIVVGVGALLVEDSLRPWAQRFLILSKNLNSEGKYIDPIGSLGPTGFLGGDPTQGPGSTRGSTPYGSPSKSGGQGQRFDQVPPGRSRAEGVGSQKGDKGDKGDKGEKRMPVKP